MKTNQSQTAPAEVRENIMGTMEINPLLLKLSIPMMISMLVQALYNVVDSVFVSHVSESALTAVSLAFSLPTPPQKTASFFPCAALQCFLSSALPA